MDLTKRYNVLSNGHCHEILEFLSECNINFCLLCKLTEVNFSPCLPHDIISNFKELIVFVLAGYTFDSLEISQDSIEFEAGFGDQNIGSSVDIKLNGILQIFTKDLEDNDLVLFNRYEKITFKNQENFIEQDKNNSNEEDKINQKNFNDSLNAILSNPRNHKIIKNAQETKKR